MFQKKSHRINIMALALFIFSLALPLHAADSKVGYINLQRLVQESKMGKAAMAEIEKLRQSKQDLISEKMKTINDLKLDLEKNIDPKKEEARKNKIESLNELIKDYKRLVDDAKEEIAKEDQELVAAILKKADGALQKVAKKNGFTMILKDPNAVGFLDPSVDITNEVLAELNKS